MELHHLVLAQWLKAALYLAEDCVACVGHSPCTTRWIHVIVINFKNIKRLQFIDRKSINRKRIRNYMYKYR